MNMKNIFYCLLPGLLLGACSNKVYEKTGDSVIVKVQHKDCLLYTSPSPRDTR